MLCGKFEQFLTICCQKISCKKNINEQGIPFFINGKLLEAPKYVPSCNVSRAKTNVLKQKIRKDNVKEAKLMKKRQYRVFTKRYSFFWKPFFLWLTRVTSSQTRYILYTLYTLHTSRNFPIRVQPQYTSTAIRSASQHEAKHCLQYQHHQCCVLARFKRTMFCVIYNVLR